MLAALAVVVPLGLGGALSPIILTEQSVLLARPDGGTAATRFAAGVAFAALVMVVAIVLFGHALSLPTEPHLDATLDLVLGTVLLCVGIVLFERRRRDGATTQDRDDAKSASGGRKGRAAFPFGLFAMATNFTTLALMLPAAKEISRADAGTAAEAVLIVVLVVLVSMPAWVPLALTRVAPGPSERGLTAVRNLIERRGQTLTVWLLGAAGLFFIARGLIRLLG
jgi:hypothetical protein